MVKNNQKKITFLISSLSGGGAERVTCNLANYVYKNGYIVDVITLSNKNDTYKLIKGVRRICLLDNAERAGKIHNLLTEWKRLKQYVIENRDISCYVTMLPINSFMLAKLKRYFSAKMIISERSDPSSYDFIKRFMMNYAAKRCDAFVVQTKEICKWYKNINNKIIIPNAINKDILFKKQVIKKKKIVAVGRLVKQKNYPMIIESFRQFSVKHPEYILEIYGQGSDRKKLEAIVCKYGLSNKIRFMGYVKNISSCISSATCFVMASDFEGMPNALIEAMCIGLPCISTDCDGGGAKDLIVNMENGILIKKGSINEMASSLNRIVEDKELRDKISHNAKKLASRLDYAKIYGMWLELINQMTREMRNEE